MPTHSDLIQAWLAQPSPPSRQTVPFQRVTKNKNSLKRRDTMACAHEYVPLPNYTDKETGEEVVNQSFCPNCSQPDFRRLQCRHCERPQADSGTCPGH